MWTTATRQLTFSGTVRRPDPGGVYRPLPGAAVDVCRIQVDQYGDYSFERLNSLPGMTDLPGNFSFTDLPVQVRVRTMIPGSPPGLPVEIVEPASLPTLAFFISTQVGEEFIEVFDERLIVDDDWVSTHTDRQNVPLTGSSPIAVDIPELVGAPAVPGNQFHFLRVGRVTRDEIDEVTDPKPGYMNSATPSFIPGIVDAPFGGTLQIGGHFGPNLMNLGDDLYYRLWFSPYSGNPVSPFDPASKTQMLDSLFNKKYILPTSPGDKGTWQTMNLGPFTAHDTSTGTTVQVYQRPPKYMPAVEYYPFHDLMAIWKSTAASNELVIIAIEVYEKTGEVAGVAQLTPITLTASVNDHIPLQIDNRRPVPKFNSWETGYATFTPAELLGSIAVMDPCGEMPVTPGHTDGNECLQVNYSVEDGSGNAHPHLRHYHLWVEYSPRQVAGAPLSANVKLRGQGSNPAFGLGLGKNDINGSYTAATPPVYSVFNYESVLVPQDLDGWPPEPNGDPPSPCTQYAAEVSLGCSVRTINGWGRIFSHRHASRHIIIKR